MYILALRTVSEFEKRLRHHLAGKVGASAEEAVALERHYELMVRWNRVLNLTAIRDMESASLAAARGLVCRGSRLRFPNVYLSVADRV